MKLKLNVDKAAIQGFFLHNVEKIVLGGVVVGFVLIVYQAFVFARNGFEAKPGDQLDAADAARRHWEEDCSSVPEVPVTKYNEIVDKVIKGKIKESSYACPAPLDKPLFPQRGLRGAPRLCPVEDLRGAAAVGPFTMKVATERPAPRSPGGATRPRQPAQGPKSTEVRGQRWVVLTGLVPLKKQTDAFEECFQDSVFRDDQKDIVEYRGYWVERAEVTSPDAAANLDWTKVAVKQFDSPGEMQKADEQWHKRAGSDVVDRRFINERITFPLGPLNDRLWGPEVAHRPEIPLTTDEEQDLSGDPAAPPGEDPDRSGTPFDTDDGATTRRQGTVVRHQGQDEELDYVLFRFFDFTVEPGKHYCYRVRLVLGNPNHGVLPSYLKSPDLGERSWSETLPSDPSDVVSVPRDTRLLAVSVTPPPATRIAAEPSGKMMIIKWVNKSGIEAFTEETVTRGKVVNFPGRMFPDIKEPRKDDDAPLPQPIRRANADEPIPVDYITDAITLDMRGGELLPGEDRVIAPGEILLLDPYGALVVRDEVADLPEYEQRTKGEQEIGDTPFLPGPAPPPAPVWHQDRSRL